ncbi:MAG: hypothetical protein HY758_09260 [Nitrospirae bacterium]|nr:hypothetical protein [Nitrospirota bacterium]
MFKLIFKTIGLLIIIVLLAVALALWKGGEPFRWIGEKTESAGQSVVKFGDKVDELREGGKKAEKKIMDLKDRIEQKIDLKQTPKDKNGTADQDK